MFYVYLLASKPYGTLYIGTTSDLPRRVWEHKNKLVPGFTKRYGVDRLVWFEIHQFAAAALRREKQLQVEARLEDQLNRKRQSALDRPLCEPVGLTMRVALWAPAFAGVDNRR